MAGPLTAKQVSARNERAMKTMRTKLITLVSSERADWPPLPTLGPEESGMVRELLSKADGARDLALLLLSYAVGEGRPLNLIDPAGGDVPADRARLQGDRTASDRQAVILRTLGIQSTSPLQNSSFRSGYMS